MGKSIWSCAPKAVRVGVCVFILALVFSEILHREPQSVALLIQLYDPLFPLYAPWAEDKALYVLRAAMLVPVGALLWRDAKHPLAWSGGILALALALEIVQVAFRLYYFRLYAVLACAAGLAVGAGFDAALGAGPQRPRLGAALRVRVHRHRRGIRAHRRGADLYGRDRDRAREHQRLLLAPGRRGGPGQGGLPGDGRALPAAALAGRGAVHGAALPGLADGVLGGVVPGPGGSRGRGVPAAGPGGVKRAHVFEIGKITGKEKEEEKWKKR